MVQYVILINGVAVISIGAEWPSSDFETHSSRGASLTLLLVASRIIYTDFITITNSRPNTGDQARLDEKEAEIIIHVYNTIWV